MNQGAHNSRLSFEPHPLGRELPACAIRLARSQDLAQPGELARAAVASLCPADYTPGQMATLLRFGLGVDEASSAIPAGVRGSPSSN